MIDWLALAVSVLTEIGIALTHTSAPPPHTHWSQRRFGWWRWKWQAGKANWYHVFSFAGHWPIQIAWLWSQDAHWLTWVMAGILGQVAWGMAKRLNGKTHWSKWK